MLYNAYGRRLLATVSANPGFTFRLEECTREPKTWEQLIEVSAENRVSMGKMLAVLNDPDCYPDLYRKLMNNVLERGLITNLFARAEANKQIKDFLCDKEYDKDWRAKVEDAESNFLKDDVSGIPAFNLYMGLYLAAQYEAWLGVEMEETPEAKKIAEEADKRGICIKTMEFVERLARFSRGDHLAAEPISEKMSSAAPSA